VIILTVAIAAFEPTRAYAVPFFIIGLAIVFVIVNLLVDLSYALINPRIRLS